MTYFVLARKWRPQTFEEIVGQEHITTTLKNAISSGRIAHAYLFTGPRGVGKTSAARIFAKALSCEKGPTTVPCNTCIPCKEITTSISLDCLEIDGASNTSVEQIRELRENVKLSPSSCPFKIYIIDEVHMLSTSAFNALLKTLEEPPAHVKFIFATTQPHKLPPTIISRCQRFDFKRIPLQKIVSKLKEISASEKIDIEESALFHIASISDGSMRDAQSILDQLISYRGGNITATDITSFLGITGIESYFDFTEKVIQRDAGEILELINSLILEGKDILQFITGLIEHFRNLIVLKINGSLDSLISQTAENIQRLKEETKHFAQQDLLYGFSILVAAQEHMRRSSAMRIPLEIAAVKLTQLGQLKALPEILEELRKGSENLPQAIFKEDSPEASRLAIEKIMPSKGVVGENVKNGPSEQRKVQNSADYTSENHASVAEIQTKTSSCVAEVSAETSVCPIAQDSLKSETKNSEAEILEGQWTAVVEAVKRESLLAGLYLDEGRILKIDNNQVFVGFHNEKNFHLDYLEKKENRQLIEKKLNEFFGRQFKAILVRLEEDRGENKPLPFMNTPAATVANMSEKLKGENPIIEAALNIFGGKIVAE